MSGIASTARAASSSASYLLKWSDPTRRITVEWMRDALMECMETFPTGVVLQGMLTTTGSRNWTVMFTEPLVPGGEWAGSEASGDKPPVNPFDLQVVGIVVPLANQDAIVGEAYACRSRLASHILLITVEDGRASMALLNVPAAEIAPLTEFPFTAEQFVSQNCHPFETGRTDAPQVELAVRSDAERQEPSSPRIETVSTATAAVAQDRTLFTRLRITRSRSWVWAVGIGFIVTAAWYLASSPAVVGVNQTRAHETRHERVRADGTGIQVTWNASNLKVEWDRNLAIGQSVNSAVLKIKDGDQLFAIPLSKSDLAAGHLLYPPRSNNLQVELAIETPSGPIIETRHVILAVIERSASEVSKRVADDTERSNMQLRQVQPAKELEYHERTTPAVGSKPLVVPMVVTGNPAVTVPPAVEVRIPQPSSLETGIPVHTSQLPGPPPVAPQPAIPTSRSQDEQQALPLRSTQVFQPPIPVKQVGPIVPAILRQAIFRAAVVEVKASVNAAGEVVDVQTQPYTGVAAHLAECARNAARLWKFRPAHRDGKPTAGDYTIVFRFDRTTLSTR